MSRHRLLNAALVFFFVLVPACAYLLDGPSELDAMQATAASVQDGEAAETARLKMIAAQAHKQAVRAKKEAQKVARESALASTQLAAAQ